MNLSALDNVSFDPNERGSIAYAKARSAIELVAKNRREKREAKQVVINALGGVLQHPKKVRFGEAVHKTVVFPDQSKAIY